MEKHTALLEIEGRKERQTPGPGREEQVQPIWHVELESETHTDPDCCRAFLPWSSSYLRLSLPPSASLYFNFSSSLHLSVQFSPTQINHYVFLILSLTLGPFFLLLLLLIFVFPSLSSSQPRLTSTAMGYFLFISLSCSRTRAFAVRLLCYENRASPERHIIGVSEVYSNFTLGWRRWRSAVLYGNNLLICFVSPAFFGIFSSAS